MNPRLLICLFDKLKSDLVQAEGVVNFKLKTLDNFGALANLAMIVVGSSYRNPFEVLKLATYTAQKWEPCKCKLRKFRPFKKTTVSGDL